MQNSSINYTQAQQRLNEIVEEIERGNIDIDELLKRVKEASELVKYCRDKLRGAEDELNGMMEEMK